MQTYQYSHRTASEVVDGENRARLTVHRLMHASVWYAVTPLPDDQWQVSVKAGDGDILCRCLDDTKWALQIDDFMNFEPSTGCDG